MRNVLNKRLFTENIHGKTFLFQILYIILAPLFYFYIASIQFDAGARARNFP